MSDTESAAATGLPSQPPPTTEQIEVLVFAVRAIDDRWANGQCPQILRPAMRLARAVVAAHAAGVQVTAGEAARALADALRSLSAEARS